MGNTKRELQNYRKQRVRRKVQGTAERPRLTVFRSLQHLYAQLIDDQAGKTLASASTIERESRSQKLGATVAGAKHVGQALADRAKALNISQVIFDRGACRYHGRVQALADAAREKGLEF
jgi:large subunit ribosomal protein L18